MKELIEHKKSNHETAILYGFIDKNDDTDLAELKFLTESAGVRVIDEVAQKVETPTPRHYIRPGSVKDLAEIVDLTKPDMVIFDTELKGSQRNHLEDDTGVAVIDRTELILDIFASRANTREGKLQVELAQLMYQLPRLMGMGKRLSNLGAGIGTRGPGETQLELDRRKIKLRITHLKAEIEKIVKHRGTQRKRRMGSKILKVALVGYTNAGKSTLLTALTGSSAYADDRLFATLDTLTRRGYLANSYREFLVTDTVGFIRRIPTQLIAAFKATLEEICYANLLLVVVDITDDDLEAKLNVVIQTLEEIDAGEIPRLIVFNKVDLVNDSKRPDVAADIAVSALKGTGVDKLLEKIDSITLNKQNYK